MNILMKRLLEAIATLPANPTKDDLTRIKVMRDKIVERPDTEKELLDALRPFAMQGAHGGRLVNDLDYERAIKVYEKVGGR